MTESLMVTCRCGTVYDAGDTFYCPVCSAPRNVAQPMQQAGPGPMGPPPAGPVQGGPPPAGGPGYFQGPAGPPPSHAPAPYPGFDAQPPEKSKADVAAGVAKLLQVLSFAALALGIIAALVIIFLTFTSSGSKGEHAVEFLTTLLTTVGFFGLLRLGALIADYMSEQYEGGPRG